MRFLFTLLLFCSFLKLQAQCQYTLKLTDLSSDGWDIGFLTVSLNGNQQEYKLDGINDNGASLNVILDVKTGDVLTLTWSESFFNGEVGITLLDGNDQLLFAVNDPNAGAIYIHSVVCPSCVRPTGVFVENTFATSAKLRWNPVGNALKYRVIYGPKNFSTGQGDTIFSNTPKATITGLSEMTEYSYYVTTICPAQDTSLTNGPFHFKTYWSDDLAVTDIDLPVSNCDLGIVNLAFKLTNFGANPQTLFNYYFFVNGQSGGVAPPADGLWTGVIGKDSTITIPFETIWDFTASGEYEVCVQVDINNSATDDNLSNNRFCKRITNALTAPYAQDFEVWEGGWHPENALPDEPNSWQHGKPNAQFINKAASGTTAWVTNLQGNYPNNELSYLISPCFDFSTSNETPAIFFNAIYDLEANYDYVALEMSTDGGNTWTSVGSTTAGLNWYNTTVDGNPCWSGQTPGWQPTRTLLTGAAGKDSVMLRFVFNSDPLTQEEGFGVDNIQISVPKQNDLAAVNVVTSAELKDCGSATDMITLTVANFGLTPQSNFTIQYSLNGGAPVSQTINQTIAPNTIANFTFSVPFNSLGNLSTLMVEVINSGDQILSNNTFNYTIDHRPKPLPFVENFENGLPGDWTVTPNAIVTQGHGNTSNVLAFNLYEFDKQFIYDLPNYGLIAAGDSLTYQYRVVNFLNGAATNLSSNSLRVQVSTDCGSSYTTIDLVNGSNHTPTLAMTSRAVDLTPYAGQAVKIRFRGQHTTGDFFLDLDNIGIRARAVSTDPDLPGGMLRLYPNPASGMITLEGAGNNAAALTVRIFGVVGNQMYIAPISVADTFSHQIDVSQYPVGVYFVQISDGYRSQTLKLVKTEN